MAVYDYAKNDMYIAMAPNFRPAYNNNVFYFDMDYWFGVLPSDHASDENVEYVENEAGIEELFEKVEV